MADYPHPSSEGRSANMRAIRRTGTKPELALRRALHKMGYRYRKDYRLDLAEGMRVRPDIVFTARKVAVFVDGCFWHACPEHGSKPAVNQGYWGPKLARNVERDRIADTALTQAGWQVVRLWEHVPLEAAVEAVQAALSRTSSGRTSSGGDEGAAGGAGAAGAADGGTGGAGPACQDRERGAGQRQGESARR
ncbi:MAG TPA: very short patch repair endonuclease [Streptosporangiaceae bacterium]|nr:very short patch repair endonuclease [Streptosporangiaceae bacterium]